MGIVSKKIELLSIWLFLILFSIFTLLFVSVKNLFDDLWKVLYELIAESECKEEVLSNDFPIFTSIKDVSTSINGFIFSGIFCTKKYYCAKLQYYCDT